MKSGVKKTDAELLEVIERENGYMIEQANEFGNRVYDNFSVCYASEKQMLDTNFVVGYINYYLHDYLKDAPEDDTISAEARKKFANRQACGILNSRIKLFAKKDNISKKELSNRRQIARSLFNNPLFKKEIEKARRMYGLGTETRSLFKCKDTDEARESIIGQLIERDENMEVLDDDKDFYAHTIIDKMNIFTASIREKFHLEDGWTDFIIAMMASPNNMPEESLLYFESNDVRCRVDSISEEQTCVTFGHGVSRAELDAVSKAIEPIVKIEPIPNALEYSKGINLRILQDHLSGRLSNKALSHMYGMSDDDDKIDNTGRNNISHIINRAKKKRGIR